MKKIFLLIHIIIFPITSEAQVTFDPPINPNGQITLYILSQGYTAATMNEFDTFTTGFLTALWSTVPFSEMQQNFRVILVRDIATINTFPRAFNQFVPPVECNTGASSGSETYQNYNDRMDTFISNNIPGFNDKSYLLAIFNNDYYTAGGGRYTFTADYSCYNQNFMFNVLIHEFGHSFGLLGDEYSTTNGLVGPNSYPLFHDRNITSRNIRADIPWNYLINSSTPIPTCTFGNSCTSTLNGLYESANYTETGWYKSLNNCKMRSVTNDFCTACQDLLREKITEHICNPSLNVNDQFVSRHQYITHWRKANNLISSNSSIANSISVNYVSGNSILLTNGFAANTGSDFRGYIGNCNEIIIRNQYKTTVPNILPPPINPVQKMTVNRENQMETVISPNPATSYVLIDANNQLITNIELFTIDGKLLYSQKVDSQESFSLNIVNYAKGIYLLSIQSNKGESTLKRLIKN